MRKTFVAIAAAAALCGATSASADTWSPTGAWQMAGSVTVSKGLTLNCTLTINATTDGSTTNATPSLSGFLCGSVSFNNTPYLAELQSDGTTLTLYNVSVNTITSGGCSGDISGQWNNVAKTLTVNTTLPETTPGTGDCTIVGTLNLVTPANGSITYP